jgi:hypothetical protein
MNAVNVALRRAEPPALFDTYGRLLSPDVPGSRFFRAANAVNDKKKIDVVDSSAPVLPGTR